MMRRSSMVPAAVLLSLSVVSANAMLAAQATPAASDPPVIVYKSATCGCCGKWNEHMRQAGFYVNSTDVPDVAPIKDKQKVPTALRSCHTALVGGYVVEGHVPADVIKKLLKERPAVLGVAVPGMPVGSPGMEQGDRKDAYQVVTFDDKGQTTVYAQR